MRDIIDMLALVEYSKANEAIKIAKGKHELPWLSLKRRMRRMFKSLIPRNHG